MKGCSPPAECECDRWRDGTTASSFAGHKVRLFDNIAKVKPKYAQQEALRQRSCLLTLQCAVQCVSFALILSDYCGDASNVEKGCNWHLILIQSWRLTNEIYFVTSGEVADLRTEVGRFDLSLFWQIIQISNFAKLIISVQIVVSWELKKFKCSNFGQVVSWECCQPRLWPASQLGRDLGQNDGERKWC